MFINIAERTENNMVRESSNEISYARTLIINNQVSSLDDLYKVVTKKKIAEILGLSVANFSNNRSNHPEEFKIKEVVKLSEVLGVDPELLFKIFIKTSK